MIGSTVSHYKILDKLGQGGMGEVYLAFDTRLKRRVALKLLPPEMAGDAERLARFRREAETLAALDHPNIVTVYSVEQVDGTPFFTMGLVDGRTLDLAVEAGKLDLDEFFELAIQITGAVAAAHDKGITHRDLKPSNIMVTRERRVKVLDFGLARIEEPIELEGDADERSTQPLTQKGLVVGTVPYMSTEQLRGRRLDHRSDIFSLGVLFYELVAGRRPFQGEGPAELISSIMKDEPVPVVERNPNVPHHLGRIIRRCLEKKPKDRYQSTRDLYNELKGLKREVDSGEVEPVSSSTVAAIDSGGRKWMLAGAVALVLAIAGVLVWQPWSVELPKGPEEAPAAAARVGRQMIVVLPFENQGPPDDEYFAAGITDEITSRLSTVGGLGVISGSSAARYERAQKSSREVGIELGVDYVLEGSVRWGGGAGAPRQVRITPRLVRAADDLQIWSEPYDRTFDDILGVQSDIAETVIRQLGITLKTAERRALEAKPTENVEAYQAYLRGMGYLRQPGFESQRQAVEMFSRAAELDPGFARAWAKVAQRSAWLHFQPDLSQDWLGRAKDALEKAQALAPRDPGVLLAEGFYHYYGFGQYERALEAFEAAARALPNDSQTLAAIGFIHRRQGKLEQALGELESSLVLDPQNSELILDLASTYRAFRRYEEADRVMEQGIATFPDESLYYVGKANNLVDWKGSTRQARAVLQSAPESADLLLSWVGLDHFDRRFEEALARLGQVQSEDPMTLGLVQFHVGFTRALQGRPDLGRPQFEGILGPMEEFAAVASENAGLRAQLGLIYALLGRRQEALREAGLAVELSEDDAFSGPRWLESLATVHALLGDQDEAVGLLERLLSMSYEEAASVNELRHHPLWDGLRDHPGFQVLLASHG